MGDPIQEALVAWVEHGDQSRGNDAIEALADEWRNRVRAVLCALSRATSEEVEDALHDALLALCLRSEDGPPRVLAPLDAAKPAAWRARVLKNYLIDRHRRRFRRDHAEQAQGRELSPRAEQEAWSRVKQRAQGDEAPAFQVVDTPVAPRSAEGEADRMELLAGRPRVLAALPHLAVRRRVLVALALGVDPSPFLQELAEELGEPVEEVFARVQEARITAHDGSHDHLSTAMIRVVYPDLPLARAREAARKAFARAIADLRARIGEGS